jgi:hypothetical protein
VCGARGEQNYRNQAGRKRDVREPRAQRANSQRPAL